MIRIEAVAPDALVDFRHTQLRPEWPRERSAYPTDHDPGVIHYAAYDGETLIGSASAHVSPREGLKGLTYQLRGMATAPAYRSQGVGARLLAAVERQAATQGARWIWCNGRTVAGRFYERAGWEPVGSEFDLSGIPHYVYIKAIASLLS